MHTRRKFLAQSSLTLGAVSFLNPLRSIAGASDSAQQENTLTILFTNGLHGNLSNSSQAGGLEAVKAAVRQVRRKAKNILLLDSGNVLSRNAAKTIGDLQLFKTLKEAGYDAITPGTTDLQHGADYFAKLVDRSRLTAVATNLANHEAVLADRIIRKGSLKIGIIGVGGAAHLSSNHFQQLQQTINQRAERLKRIHRCQLVLCLSHLPLKNEATQIDNFNLAQASHAIDVVISANDGRFTYNTHVVKNNMAHDVLISHAGKDGTMLGKLEVRFNERGEKTGLSTEQVFAGFENRDHAIAFRKHAAAQTA